MAERRKPSKLVVEEAQRSTDEFDHVDPRELTGDGAHLTALRKQINEAESALNDLAEKEETTTTKRGRPTADDVGRSQRRRRKSFGLDSMKKLFVPEHLKAAGYHHRWILDTGSRLQYMTTQDDYDICCEEDVKNGMIDPERNLAEGTAIKRVVGTNKGGEPMYAYLCRKPTDFYEEDQRAKQLPVDESEEAMRRGEVKTPPGGQVDQNTFYTPGGGTNIVGPQKA